MLVENFEVSDKNVVVNVSLKRRFKVTLIIIKTSL
jgi:hypothetical protein